MNFHLSSISSNQQELNHISDNFKLGIKYLRSVINLSINNSQNLKIQGDSSVYSRGVNLSLLNSDKLQMLKLLDFHKKNKHMYGGSSILYSKLDISGS